MPLIIWDNSLEIGIDEIDHQHRRWVEILNNLHNGLSCGDPDRLIRLNHETFDQMLDYANFHFTSEERFMEKINCPDLGVHKKSHEHFKRNLLRIQDEMKRGLNPLNTQLMSMMKLWLKEHILKEDKKICDYGC